MKILYCGLLRTGSKSICRFIQEVSGYKKCVGANVDIHRHPTDVIVNNGEIILNVDETRNLYHGIYTGNNKIYSIIDSYENMIAMGIPYIGYYKFISATYPDAKFIICIRDTESFVTSYKKYNRWLSPIAKSKLNRIVLNIDGPYDNKYDEHLKNVYESHNKKIIKYFEDYPGKLLVLKFEDIGTEKFEQDILDFLDMKNTDNIKMKCVK
jgi:hypothetical protein